MKVLITGSSRGIGRATAELFLKNGHTVIGLDKCDSAISHGAYSHFICDVCKKLEYPQIDGIEILINNAGVQNENDIDVNLKALIEITERYGVQEKIRAIVNVGSASAHTGAEFPQYCASKGGVVAYTKNVALRVARYGATCNSIDPGGVMTELNAPVIEDEKLWTEIMKETPLRRWASPEEIAEWIYFLAVQNKFCTGQSIVVDGGEMINYNFVWKE